MTTYEEEIYPSQLETSKGFVFVQSNGKNLSEMPVMIFTSWHNGYIVAMFHQGLQ